jgi:hypothetical protein
MTYSPIWMKKVVVSKDPSDTNASVVFAEPNGDRPKNAEYHVKNTDTVNVWLGTSETFDTGAAIFLEPGDALKFQCAEFISLYARKSPGASNGAIELLVTALAKANGFDVVPKGDE